MRTAVKRVPPALRRVRKEIPGPTRVFKNKKKDQRKREKEKLRQELKKLFRPSLLNRFSRFIFLPAGATAILAPAAFFCLDGEPMMICATVTTPPLEHADPCFQFELMQLI